MAEIASWNGHSFSVSPKLVRSFTGLTINGGSETEDITDGEQKYVKRVNGEPCELSLTAELSAFTGCDVKAEAMKFVDDARHGEKNYFYMGGKKLIACQLMLTEASVSETTIAPNGTWVSCKVKLTFVQCGKFDSAGGGSSSGSSSSSSSGSKKSSTKNKPVNTLPVSALFGLAGTMNLLSVRDQLTSSVSGALNKAVACVNVSRAVSSVIKKASDTYKVRHAKKTPLVNQKF